jgi:hypothetical protein
LKIAIAAMAALLAAAALAACGGGGDDSTSTSAEAGSRDRSGKSAPSEQGKAKKDGEGKQGSAGNGQPESSDARREEAAKFTPKQHSDSGGGSKKYRVGGGDNSVQEFGKEVSGGEFEAAAIALHNFLDARAEGNWAAACNYLSRGAREGFEQLAERAESIKDKSCGGILEKLTNPAAKQALKEEAAKADIGSLRVEGDRSFLIYTAAGKTILAMPMAHEGGAWKVAGLAGTPLN